MISHIIRVLALKTTWLGKNQMGGICFQNKAEKVVHFIHPPGLGGWIVIIWEDHGV